MPRNRKQFIHIYGNPIYVDPEDVFGIYEDTVTAAEVAQWLSQTGDPSMQSLIGTERLHLHTEVAGLIFPIRDTDLARKMLGLGVRQRVDGNQQGY